MGRPGQRRRSWAVLVCGVAFVLGSIGCGSSASIARIPASQPGATQAAEGAEGAPRSPQSSGGAAESEDDWRAWRPLEMGAQLGAGVGALLAASVVAAGMGGLAHVTKNEALAWVSVGVGFGGPLYGSIAAGLTGDYFSKRRVGALAAGVGMAIGFGVGLGVGAGTNVFESDGIAPVLWWWGATSLGSALFTVPVYQLFASHASAHQPGSEPPGGFQPNPGGSIGRASDLRMKFYMPIWRTRF